MVFDYENSSSYSKPDKSLINQWERKLNVRELQYVEWKLQNILEMRNYKPSGYPLRKPNYFDN